MANFDVESHTQTHTHTHTHTHLVQKNDWFFIFGTLCRTTRYEEAFFSLERKKRLPSLAHLMISDGDSTRTPWWRLYTNTRLGSKLCLNWAFWLCLGSILLILPVLAVLWGPILLTLDFACTSSISGSNATTLGTAWTESISGASTLDIITACTCKYFRVEYFGYCW